MKYQINIIIGFCFISTLFSQNNVSLSLGTEYYTGQSKYQDASGVSLNYMRQFNSAAEIGFTINYGMMAYNIPSPSTTTTVNVSIYDFYLLYGYRFGYKILTMDIKPVIGAGVKVLHREAFRIDLGALGEKESPEMSQTYFASFAGLLLSKEVSGILSFFIEPGYAFYDLKAFNNSFSIKGGINVQFN